MLSSGLALRVAISVATSILAALSAQVAIDGIGDFLLPHDTYDDAGDASRWLASTIFAFSTIGGLVALIFATVAETRGTRGALRAALRKAVPVSTPAFLTAVLLGALPALLGMAWLDAWTAGIHIDDPADLLGGCPALGLGVLLASSSLVAYSARRLFAAFFRFERSIVRTVAALLRRSCAIDDIVRTVAVAFEGTRPRASRVSMRGKCGNRAPPPRTPVTA